MPAVGRLIVTTPVWALRRKCVARASERVMIPDVRPKSVYEKVRNNKNILGQLHMEPRIYHAHYSPEVHQGKFKIESLSELHKKMLELSIDITY